MDCRQTRINLVPSKIAVIRASTQRLRQIFNYKPLSKPHADVPATAVRHSISKGKNRYRPCLSIRSTTASPVLNC